MNIILAADHAGFELKEFLKTELINDGHTVTDCGAETLHTDDDYPVIIANATKKLLEELKHNPLTKGVFIGGSGQGEAMVANRFKGIRATVYYGEDLVPVNGKPNEILFLSHEHNDANVLSLGARFMTNAQALAATILWLTNWTDGKKVIDERHAKRIALIDELTS